MNIHDFAEKSTHYTGANNKTKWSITNVDLLKQYFELCNFKPGDLARKLGTSYSTVKRFLCAANLWSLAQIKIQKPGGGRKRTQTIDKFGYKYADAKYDYWNNRGEKVRRLEHIVNAEIKQGKQLEDSAIVHHIDLDKTNNSFENLLVCKDNVEHRLVHGQLERVAGELVRLGIIKFNENTKEYYFDKSTCNINN